MTTKTNRDRSSGKYVDTDLEKVCVCGHGLGEHTAARVAGEQPCMHGCDFHSDDSCDCESFRKATARGASVVPSAPRLKPPRLKLLGTIQGLSIYLVSGEQVRNKTDIDFTAGGSEAAYPGYIPKGEIWLDDALHVLDRIATIFHEIVERNLMLYGGVDYDDAHDIACKREIVFRKELQASRPTSTDLGLVTRALKPFAKEAVPTGKRPGKASRTGSSN